MAEDIFASYDAWLGLLGDEQIRQRLEAFDHREIKESEDAVFEEIRRLSTNFARGLKLLFFNRDRDDDPIANLSLEYVGF